MSVYEGGAFKVSATQEGVRQNGVGVVGTAEVSVDEDDDEDERLWSRDLVDIDDF